MHSQQNYKELFNFNVRGQGGVDWRVDEGGVVVGV